MLRVMHVLPGLEVGGAERALERLLGAGLARTFDSHVVALGGDGPMRTAFEANGATVVHRERGPRWRLPIDLRMHLERLRPDVIQGWMYHANVAVSALTLAGRSSPPVFWNIRQSLSAPAQDKLTTRAVIRASAALARQPEGIVYNSGLARAQHERIGYPTLAGVVIPNGFPPAALEDRPSEAGALRRALGLSPDAIVIAHLGRYHPVKDHHTYLQAATQLALLEPRARFILAGRGVVPGNSALMDAIPRDLHDRFSLLGERDDVSTILAASDIFVLSSRAEAFPNALGEAMAAACACVATEVGEVPDLLARCGSIVPPGQPRLLGAAMLKYCATPQARRLDGEAARERIRRNYSLDAAVSRYTTIYEGAALRQRTI